MHPIALSSYPLPLARDLPRGRAAGRCLPDRAVLLVHDLHAPLLRGFPPDRSPVAELTHNLAKLRDTCRDLAVPVVRSADLLTGPQEQVLDFAALRALLDRDGRDQLLVAGLCAHAGCLLAAGGALLAGVQVLAVADATADLTRADHDHALHDAAARGALLTTTATVIGQFIGAV